MPQHCLHYPYQLALGRNSGAVSGLESAVGSRQAKLGPFTRTVIAEHANTRNKEKQRQNIVFVPTSINVVQL